MMAELLTSWKHHYMRLDNFLEREKFIYSNLTRHVASLWSPTFGIPKLRFLNLFKWFRTVIVCIFVPYFCTYRDTWARAAGTAWRGPYMWSVAGTDEA